MAAKGYPGDYERRHDDRRSGQAAAEVEGVEIFHAGTKPDGAGSPRTAAAFSTSPRSARPCAEAQARAYQAVDRIQWPGGFCRRDIGWQAVKRETGGDNASRAAPVRGHHRRRLADVSLPALPRMIFVVHGVVTIDGKTAARRRGLARRRRRRR